MSEIAIDKDTLRELVGKHPFYVIGRMYGCGARAIALMATAYGLTSPFVSRFGTKEEDAWLLEILDQGLSVQRIAEELGRSHDFVTRRIRRLTREEERPGARLRRSGWPVPDTTPELAFGGEVFEDVCQETLDRECLPGRLPINGPALASAGRAANMSFSRSAADLCLEA